jgi:hypothetical protein
MRFHQGWGIKMRAMSFVKIALLVGAVALPASFSAAEAKMMKLPPGACKVGKKSVCSYNCDPKTMACAQQACWNGALNQVLPCWSSFCSPKCGG